MAVMRRHVSGAARSARPQARGRWRHRLEHGWYGRVLPAPVVTPEIADKVMRDIIKPTVDGMGVEGCPFTGVIFAGLMITKDGNVKSEHNIRFGDPECQVLMARLTSDLTALLLAAANGTLENAEVTWSDDSAVVVVMAANGYPGSYAKGEVISKLDAAGDIGGVKVLHAEPPSSDAGDVVSAGGRVLGVTAYGSSITEAAARSYQAVDTIEWPGGFNRRDIGWRAIAREKRVDDNTRNNPRPVPHNVPRETRSRADVRERRARVLLLVFLVLTSARPTRGAHLAPEKDARGHHRSRGCARRQAPRSTHDAPPRARRAR